MIRTRSNKDTSYTDRCLRCPRGTFQIFSTIFSEYNPNTLQPTDADFDDPVQMCAQCPVGTSCPRSTPQQQDFGFTVGIHIIPHKGFWLNSMLLHFHQAALSAPIIRLCLFVARKEMRVTLARKEMRVTAGLSFAAGQLRRSQLTDVLQVRVITMAIGLRHGALC
jgi:hypothetical protein